MAASTHKVGAAITVIQSLADTPTESTSALKAKFDEGAEAVRVKHDALCDYADTDLATKAELAAVVLGAIPDGSISNAKLATDVKVGSLAALTTTEKGSLVGAINEIETDVATLNASKALAYYGKYSQMSGGVAFSTTSDEGASGYITYTTEDKDDFSCLDVSTGKITIPAGVTLVRFYGLCSGGVANGDNLSLSVKKNNATNIQSVFSLSSHASGTSFSEAETFATTPIPVVAGDYYQLSAYGKSGYGVAVTVNAPIFGMEVLG